MYACSKVAIGGGGGGRAADDRQAHTHIEVRSRSRQVSDMVEKPRGVCAEPLESMIAGDYGAFSTFVDASRNRRQYVGPYA